SESRYATLIRARDRNAYHGSALGDVEISGPAITGGAPNARRTPAYRSDATPRNRTTSAVVNGAFGSAGLKRKRRTCGFYPCRSRVRAFVPPRGRCNRVRESRH